LDGRGDGWYVGLQAVVAVAGDDLALLAGGWYAEGVSCSLHNEGRDGDLVEFGKAAWCRSGSGTAWGLEGEGEADDADRAGRGRCPAGNPGAQGSPADDEWPPVELGRVQVLDHCCPGLVEVWCWWRGSSTGDAVGLLDECDADPERAGGIGDCDEIGRRDAAAGSMAENQRPGGMFASMQVDSCRAVRCVHVEHV